MVISEIPIRMTLDDFIRNRHWDNVSVIETGLFFKALHATIFRHWNQKRDDGKIQYYEHPLVVADTLHQLGFDTEVQIAGLLHDVMDDCGMSYTEIRKTFGVKIADMVESLSKVEGEDYFELLFSGTKLNFQTVFIRIADRGHNLATIYGIRSQARQVRYLEETIGPLRETFLKCRQLIPEDYLVCYDELVDKIDQLAKERLAEIHQKIA